MSTADFLARLQASAPETTTLVSEHLGFYDEMLLHVLMADVMRFCEAAFERGDRKLLDRCLNVVEQALRDGDDEVRNAVAVSFVENTGWWDEAALPFVDAWPPGLRAEVDRQRSAGG